MSNIGTEVWSSEFFYTAQSFWRWFKRSALSSSRCRDAAQLTQTSGSQTLLREGCWDIPVTLSDYTKPISQIWDRCLPHRATQNMDLLLLWAKTSPNEELEDTNLRQFPISCHFLQFQKQEYLYKKQEVTTTNMFCKK